MEKSKVLELMEKYFNEAYDRYLAKRVNNSPSRTFLNTPTFVVRSHPRLHAWFKLSSNEIGISTQSANVATDVQIKSLVYHEAIHYAQLAMNYRDRRYTDGGHDSVFKEIMAEMNADAGFKLVKITEEPFAGVMPKSYVVAGFEHQGKYYFGRITKPANVAQDMQGLSRIALKYPGAKLFAFSSNDAKLFRNLPVLSGKSGGVGAFRESGSPDHLASLAQFKSLADSNIVDWKSEV